ncbi:hypothetical protein [Phenylobacterium sp.]|uniref:hypothetical protein n=1 Tax=Phenylobacterium sp. TaxID=1871053 RepID=UPI00286A8EB2|nr:hypothetical protein [Phenylobacterium sp.]
MRASPLLLPALFLLSACMTAPADGSGQIQTTSEAKRESIEGAVAAPLRDVNLLRTKIPAVLLEALADPYQRPSPSTCARLVALIQPINEAMGDDLDEPDDADQSVQVRGRDAALGAVASATSDIIPFRGWVRKLSGAERHDNLVAAAITAGGVRRAYLKGLGEAKGCNPPATPSHTLAGTPVPEQGLKPRYPIR